MLHKTYTVRTRNWNESPALVKLLNIPTGYDTPMKSNSFIITVKSFPKALIIWAYWKLLEPLSGGWTYIKANTNNESMHEYKNFYL